MGWFRREPTADNALVATAARQGWEPIVLDAFSMIPPSHAAVDVHDLGSRRPPHCAGRAMRASLGSGLVATVSHVQIHRNEYEDEVYDMVRWPVPADAARFEVLAGADSWNHHRLGDRFGRDGWRSAAVSDGVKIRLSRATPPDVAAIVTSDVVEYRTMAALGAQVRHGIAAESLGGQAAVFVWAGVAQRGADRWMLLCDAAVAFAALVDRSVPVHRDGGQ